MKVAAFLFVSLLSIALAGCGEFSRPAKTLPDSIALRVQTGMMGQTYTIRFSKDDTASLECTYYNLGKNSEPYADSNSICDALYAKTPAAFRRTDDRMTGKFTGTNDGKSFLHLASLLNDQGYYSMSEGSGLGGMTLDAPPSFVEVKHDGRLRSVGDKSFGNEKLQSIKDAIYLEGREVDWRKE